MRRTIGALAGALMLATVVAAQAATPPAVRAHEERAFLKLVDAQANADHVTGDLQGSVGKHVEFHCDVEEVVRDGVMIGQCGNPDEPVDVFVKLATRNLHIGDHLRVLGIIDQPAVWADVTGHAVYYAFVRAVFVDREKAAP